MKSPEKLMALAVLAMTMMVSVVEAYDHGDHVCMVCPCGPHQCSGNSATCCYTFNTNHLARLGVTVDCSNPSHSHIVDPIVLPHQLAHGSSNCSGFHLLHENSCLTAFPDNYCHYVATRAVSLSRNALSEFPDLKCLVKLGRLDLTHNKLTSIPQEAFKGLTYIRDIFLDYNEISYIHPLAFDQDMTELARFSVSYNRLLTLEAWPMALHYSFCYFDFSHNLVHHLSNRAHWRFNTSVAAQYGPGFVDFSYNRFEDGPGDEIKQYGIDSILGLAKFMKWGFDFRHNPFRCDCKLYNAVKWGKRLAEVLWRDYFNVTCGSPTKFRNFPVLDLPLEDFVCNVTTHCPAGCYCEDKPANKSLFIFCDGAGLTSLPDALPEGNHLVIHMANNVVHRLEPRHYLTRVQTIDLRDSRLKHISKDTPHLLTNVQLLDLRHNELHHLPSTFQTLDPHVVLLDLHTLKCSCDLDWVSAWLRHSHVHRLAGLTCTKDDGERILLIDSTKHDLCDNPPHADHTTVKVTLIVILAIVALVTLALVTFRYEAQVMVHVYTARRIHRKQFPALLTTHRHDLFISMDGDSNSDSEWVRTVLEPCLDRHGLTSYLPPRDCIPGTVEMDEATKRLQDSANALVVLSPEYVRSASCLFQFTRAYSHMVARKQGHLLIIRRDGELPRRSACEPHLRAMINLRMFYSDDPKQLDKALDSLVVDQGSDL